MRVKWFLVRMLWRGIRWRKAFALWLLTPKRKPIKPLSSKRDGLSVCLHVVDEWAAAVTKPWGGGR